MTRITVLLALVASLALTGCSTSQNHDLPPPEFGSGVSGASSSAMPAARIAAQPEAG
jgi:hypothetical protein